MSKPAIIVDGISKAYRIGVKEQRFPTFRDAVISAAKAPLRRFHNWRTDVADHDDAFWALKDVSFEVQPGEIVGIIGRNGAGKSTLLKILSRITEPTSGEVRIRGRVASLLEVGTGFHPELTGRENIYLNGAILGMKRSEITRKFDEIVAFAETGKFLDTPVKHYSSGMFVRLAFAVAAHLEPEILIVDEVLAVGDAEFQKKCLGKMQEVSKGEGRTVLFVSHNLLTVTELCTRATLLSSGRMDTYGDTSSTINAYLDRIGRSSLSPLNGRIDRGGTGDVRLQRIEFGIEGGDEPTVLPCSPMVIHFICDRLLPQTECAFTIYDNKGYPVAHFNSDDSDINESCNSNIENVIIWETKSIPLAPGCYRMNVSLHTGDVLYDHVEGAVEFKVLDVPLKGHRRSCSGKLGEHLDPSQLATRRRFLMEHTVMPSAVKLSRHSAASPERGAPAPSETFPALIGHLGTFDVHNYGDLLYPLLLDRILASRRLPRSFKFGVLGGKAYRQQAYAAAPLKDLFRRRHSLKALLVGGGDIIRTDWGRICTDYGSRLRPLVERDPRFWLRKVLAAFRGKSLNWTGYARWMLLRHGQVGPFIINSEWLGRQTSVAYLSVGVVHDIRDESEAVRRAFNSAAIAYVRDAESARRLRDCGVECRFIVAPDLAVLVGRYWDGAVAKKKGDTLLRASGLDTDRRILVFQCNADSAVHAKLITHALVTAQRHFNCQIAFLPIGHCLGDEPVLRRLAAGISSDAVFINPGTVDGILDVIAAATFFCGTSMHGCITAFSFKVPFVIGPIDVPKIAGFMKQCGVPEQYRLQSWGELSDRMQMVCAEADGVRDARVASATHTVERAVDEVMAAVNCSTRIPVV